MFIDRVKIRLSAGKGGNGVVAWRREKYIPKGGPCGGNGGRGADVIIQADAQLMTLDHFRNRRIIRAENGKEGGINQMQGRSGKQLILHVPCGTLIKDAKTDQVLFDLIEDKQSITLCKGGKGGRGNMTFKTPTHRAPNICTPGKPGEEIEVVLEMKLIAEVGLIGFPNAGKSTLLNTLTRIKVKTAAYPFTTLHPNLGFITFDDYSRCYIADIPGIIEGAHQNRGLGFEFLRHVERTKILVFILDASGIDGRNPFDDWKILCDEISKYNPELLNRPNIVVLNKIDTEEASTHILQFKERYPFDLQNVLEISALQEQGISDLIEKIRSLR